MYTLVPDVVYHVSKVSKTLAIERKLYKLLLRTIYGHGGHLWFHLAQ